MYGVVDISALYYYIAHGMPSGEEEKICYASSYDTCTFSAEFFDPRLFPGERFGPGRTHLAVYDRRSRVRSEHVVFRSYSNPLPPKSFIQLDENICVASPELVFVEAGRRLNLVQQIELGFEMMGRYRLTPDKRALLISHAEPLMSVDSLACYLDNAHDFWGVKQARKALLYVREGAESAAETKFALLLGLPRKYGGEGFEGFVLNQEIVLPEELSRISGRASLRMDLCFPEKMLELEYDSDEFHPDTPRSRENDALRRSLLQELGFETISVTNTQMRNLPYFQVLVRTLNKRFGRNVKKKDSRQLAAQAELRRMLFEPKERLKRQYLLWH